MADAIIKVVDGRAVIAVSGDLFAGQQAIDAAEARAAAAEAVAARDVAVAAKDDAETAETNAETAAAAAAASEASAEADAASAAASAADAEAILEVPGFLGDIPTKSGDGGGSIIYSNRPALSDQPKALIDTADNAARQILIDNGFSNPTTRATASVVSGNQRVTLNAGTYLSVNLATAARPVKNRLFRAGGKVITNLNAAPNIWGGWGFGVAFRPSAPVPGATVANDTTGVVHVILRWAGAVNALNFSGGNGGTPAAGVTITNQAYYAQPIDLMSAIRVDMTPLNDTGTSCQFVWWQNGRMVAKADVAGLPANAYLAPTVRMSAAVGNVFEFYDLEYFAQSLDVPKYIYMDPAAAVGGAGTLASPFGTSAEAFAAIAADAARKHFVLNVNGGTWYDFGLNIPTCKIFEIRGKPGSTPKFIGAVEVPTGAPWVNVSGEVWKIPNPADGSNFGGIVQTDRPSTFGKNGLGSETYSFYGRRAPDYAPGSLLRGEMTAHFAGTHDGHILVRCWDGSNPNTHTWRLTTQNAVIDGRKAEKLILRNFEVEAAYLYGGWYENSEIDEDGTTYRQTMVGYGVDYKGCSGTVTNSVARGTYVDNVHWNDSLPGEVSNPFLEFDGCTYINAWYYNVSGFFAVGDNISNHHERNGFRIKNSTLGHCGKDNISSSGDVHVIDCHLLDAYDTGFKIYMTPGFSALRRGTMTGGSVTGCTTNIKLEGGAVEDANGRMDLYGVTLDSRIPAGVVSPSLVGRHLWVYSGATAKTLTMVANDCRKIGPTPTSGDSSATAGTTLTINTSSPF